MKEYRVTLTEEERLRLQATIAAGKAAAFVAAMEDVLEVYHRPYDEARPLVCPDEASKQLVGEVAEPIAAEPGQPERYDYESTRNGTADLLMVAMPLRGWRAVHVTERRTALDFAEVVRWLVEEVPEEAEKVVLVMDYLNTHEVASLYEASRPKRARRIAERLGIHHTPMHGSWLNRADTAKLIRHDLEAAGLPYRDASGRVADFHALRHSYITALAMSKAPVKVIQSLARHSSPTLTLGIYAHVGLYDQTAVLEALPGPTATGPEAEPAKLAATGTDGP